MPADQLSSPAAVKHDQDKPKWTLLMRGASQGLAGILAVLMFGAKKYGPHGWQEVPDGHTRYTDALYRHMHSLEKNGPDAIDPESGLPEVFHVATNALFLAHLVARDNDKQVHKVP
jgi:hypothetical protein